MGENGVIKIYLLLTDVSARFEPLCAAKTHGQLLKSFHRLPVGASGGLKTRAWLDYGGRWEHNNTSGGGKVRSSGWLLEFGHLMRQRGCLKVSGVPFESIRRPRGGEIELFGS